MLRGIPVVVMLAALLASSAPASAQSFNPIGSSVQTLQPLPDIPCVGMVSYAYQLCQDIEQAIIAYNGQVRALNSIRDIEQRQAMYLRYPQRLQSYVQQDLSQLQQIATQTQQSLNWDAQIQQRMNEIFQTGQARIDQSTQQVLAQVQQAGQTYRDDLLRGLGDTATLSQQGQRDDASADALLSVTTHVQNPTQAVQILTHLTGLLYNAVSRVQTQQADQLRFDLSKAQDERANQNRAVNVTAQLHGLNQQVLDPTLPSPPPQGQP